MSRDYRSPVDPPLTPLALAMRVDSNDAAHVHVSVFCGPDDEHRAHIGHLTFTMSDFEALQERNMADIGLPSVLFLGVDMLKPIRHVVVMSAPDIDTGHEDDIGAEMREREIGR